MARAKGYDVSDHQSGIPKDAQFVFVKATEGAHTGQSGYARKVADARHRGLVVGHYHFLHAENAVRDEIDHFCRVVGKVPTGELLALDFEPDGQRVGDAHATKVKNEWLAAVGKRYPHHRVGLYVNLDHWHRTDDNAGDFLWIADPGAAAGRPRVKAAWRFHQYTDRPLDTDVYHGTLAELRAWAGGKAGAAETGGAAGAGGVGGAADAGEAGGVGEAGGAVPGSVPASASRRESFAAGPAGRVALSVWRTCVPYGVAFLGLQAARLGIRCDDATLASALTAGGGTVYYAVFRLLEHRFGAGWGWLLGAPRPPACPAPAVALHGDAGSP